MSQAIPTHPVSLSGRFLFEGAKLLPNPAFPGEQESIAYPVGRALWSLGLVVVAPAGVFWHVGCAARCALDKLCRSDEATCKQLHERTFEHLGCALRDGLGILFMCILGPAFLATLVAYGVFGGMGWGIAAALATALNILLIAGVLLESKSPLEMAFWYAFAKNPMKELREFIPVHQQKFYYDEYCKCLKPSSAGVAI